MYDPRIQYTVDMVRQIHDRHMDQLAFLELTWERIFNGTLSDGSPKLVQIVPVILSQAKG